MSPGRAPGPRRPAVPSACSSEFMSAGSSGHGRGPVHIAAPRPPPGQQRQLPPLTAPLGPSSSHRPLPTPATLIGHLCRTPQLRRFSIGQLLHRPRGPSVGRSAGGAKSCRRPGSQNAGAASCPGEELQPVRARSAARLFPVSGFVFFFPQMFIERPLPSRQCSDRSLTRDTEINALALSLGLKRKYARN